MKRRWRRRRRNGRKMTMIRRKFVKCQFPIIKGVIFPDAKWKTTFSHAKEKRNFWGNIWFCKLRNDIRAGIDQFFIFKKSITLFRNKFIYGN